MKLDKNGNIKEPKIELKLPDFTPVQQTQTNEYGINVPQLELWIWVRGEATATTWSNAKVLSFTATSAWGTWIRNFTWFWFTPTSYSVHSWYTGSSQTYCLSSYDGTTEKWMYWRTYAGVEIGTTGRVVQIRTWSSPRTYGVHDAFLSDGVAIDFSGFDVDIELMITAYP